MVLIGFLLKNQTFLLKISVEANTDDVHDNDSIHTETQGKEINVDSNMDELHVENNNLD